MMDVRRASRGAILAEEFRSKTLRHLLLILGLLAGGTLLFSLVDGQSLADSLYFIVMVMTLIGANNPHTVAGELVGIVVAAISVVIVLSFLTQVLGPATVEAYREHRSRRVSRMENHVVVCGFSDTAQALVNRLPKEEILVVVKDRPTHDALSERGMAVLLGDYETLEVLRRAGVPTCRAVVAASPVDSENAFICLTVKRLARHVPVYATVSSQENVEKLEEVKADHIISPALLSADAILKGLGAARAAT